MATVSLQSAYDQARSWIESNDPERASGLAQHILDHYPKNLEAYRILGEAHLASRQLEQAQDAFDRVLRSDPENIPAHVGLGITYERQGKTDRAIPEFEQAWEIKPDMTELRSQLLRLYSEAWGSEHAQLRLSRAGLARLYAKGHMLPQAITEFRQVIADQPNRHDAKVALAEALWRNEQENDAVALAREIVAQQPDSLKANLLLGYLLLAQGQPEGQRYWDAAAAIDPQMTVAQAMFDTLPVQPQTDLELPEWDEAAWRRQQELEKQPVPAATRPIPVPEREVPASTPARPVPAYANANNDDFLAVLLGGASQTVRAPAPIETNDEPIAADPFSLDDVDLGKPQASQAPAASSIEQPVADAEEPALEPFSFADLGLSDDELASFDSATTEASVSPQPSAQSPTPDAEEPALEPFSFADLGLSDDELASFDSATTEASVSPQPSAQSPTDDAEEPALTPFSLADLGLSDDEIASFDSATTEASVSPQPSAPATPDAEEPALTPFSLADLGLSDDEIASFDSATTEASISPQPSAQAPTDDAEEPALTPFSLADLGLSDDEIASLNDLGDQPTTPAASQESEEPALTPFSLDDLGLSDDEIASFDRQSGPSSGQTSAADDQDLPPELLPFSLDDLDLSAGSSSLPSSLQPFSLDEAPPEQPRLSNFNTPQSSTNRTPEPIDEEDQGSQSGGYSWQQPTQRSRPSYVGSTGERDPLMPEGESIFSKLKQRREREGDLGAPPETPAPVNDAVDDRILFSSDDVSLRDDLAAADLENAPTPRAAQAEAPATAESTPANPAEPSNSDLSSGIQSGQIQPFSLSDLGLSSEEIAALGLGSNSGTAQSFTSMFGEQAPTEQASVPAEAAPQAAAPAENQAPAPAAPTSDEETQSGIESLTPFSFSDLGLTDDEIAAFGFDDSPDERGLGITEEELAGLDMGGDIDLSSPETPAASAAESADPLLDRLMTLGREQGYVDIADIIAGVDNPEAEAERIEQIGMLLHENNIKIFDGDEEVDMDAEYAADDESDLSQIDFGTPATPAPSDEADMTPFSLADLGLSDDEIASLGLGETPAEQAPAANASAEPEMTPFSFADLGLSDDEIASLDLGETPAPAEQAPAANDEPAMTPFSLADLGLSDDEIASLDLGETPAPAEQAPAANGEPAMTPFSLADLGLSDDEIASLDLGETQAPTEQAPAASASAEPEMTPFSFADLGLSDDEIASLDLGEQETPEQPALGAGTNEPEMTPFSFADLGLNDDEIASLDLGEQETPEQRSAPTPATDDEPAMTPFSFSDLGLTDDEIANLGLEESPSEQPAVEQPAPEVFSLDSRLGETAAPEPASPAPQPAEPMVPQPAPAAAATPLVQPRQSPGLSNALAESVPALRSYLDKLDAEPQNHTLRLALARISGQLGQTEASIQQYKNIVRQNVLLDIVADDLGDLISDTDDTTALGRLHRLLGDVYSKQGRIDEAIKEYNWTLG